MKFFDCFKKKKTVENFYPAFKEWMESASFTVWEDKTDSYGRTVALVGRDDVWRIVIVNSNERYHSVCVINAITSCMWENK